MIIQSYCASVKSFSGHSTPQENHEPRAMKMSIFPMIVFSAHTCWTEGLPLADVCSTNDRLSAKDTSAAPLHCTPDSIRAQALTSLIYSEADVSYLPTSAR
jgi:hypothetical protein